MAVRRLPATPGWICVLRFVFVPKDLKTNAGTFSHLFSQKLKQTTFSSHQINLYGYLPRLHHVIIERLLVQISFCDYIYSVRLRGATRRLRVRILFRDY